MGRGVAVALRGMNSGAPTLVSGPHQTSLKPVRVGGKRCSVRVAEEAGIRHVRILETQLELLPVGLRLSTHGTVYLVIQSRERAPRPSLILIDVLAASSHLTGQSRTSTQSCNGGCTKGSCEQGP